MKIVVLLLFIYASAAASTPELHLVLEGKYFLSRNKIEYTLVMTGSKIEPTVVNTDPEPFGESSLPRFNAPFRSQRVFSNAVKGDHTLGPLTLQIGKETLVSKEVDYTVISSPMYGSFALCNYDEIDQRSYFRITLCSWTDRLDSVTLNENPRFEQINMSMSRETHQFNGNVFELNTRVFIIKPRYRGKIEITEKLFSGIEDEIQILGPTVLLVK